MTDHTPMQLEKYYTCYIERRWHIPYHPASARLTTDLLEFNAWIQLKIIQYWWLFWRQWCRDVASGAAKISKENVCCFHKKWRGSASSINVKGLAPLAPFSSMPCTLCYSPSIVLPSDTLAITMLFLLPLLLLSPCNHCPTSCYSYKH